MMSIQCLLEVHDKVDELKLNIILNVFLISNIISSNIILLSMSK